MKTGRFAAASSRLSFIVAGEVAGSTKFGGSVAVLPVLIHLVDLVAARNLETPWTYEKAQNPD